jgi:hypothetical protein
MVETGSGEIRGPLDCGEWRSGKDEGVGEHETGG